ncbi:MAG: hypothetical protein OWQ50_08520, partial [Acidianus infernus]|nr:hypothetical protein [Acidianus infernus]
MTETEVEELLTKIMSNKISDKDLQALQAIYGSDKHFWNKISVIVDLKLRSKKAKISNKFDNVIY